jgi:DNA (cytosine-5)-methyltransferase 1
MLTIGSLFSGIGGLELGLEWAGLGPVLWQVEKDPYCLKVLEKHWPGVRRYEDVKTIGRSVAPVDLICGGFPCQDLSYAGRGAGIKKSTRSGLWFEYARIISELRPRFVVVENVPALLTRGMDIVLGELAALGYDAWWDCIPAQAVGAPHRRDRVFVVAHATRVYVSHGNQEKNITNIQESGRCGLPNGWLTRTEPNVGRVVDGTTTELDKTIRRLGYEQSSNKEAFTKVVQHRGRILRVLWEHEQSAAPPSRGRCIFNYTNLPEVPHSDTYEGWVLGSWIEKDKKLRDMWKGISSKPFKETQDLQQRMLEYIGTQERNEKVASSRKDRLRALGNAVVPQCAQVIGEIIKELMG